MTGTPRQQQALAFIKQYIAARGYAPTYVEIGKAMNLKSKSGVHRLVIGMEARGLIRRTPDKWRSIVITKS
jgi:repressor LexA